MIKISENKLYFMFSDPIILDENTGQLPVKIKFQDGNGYIFSGWVKNFVRLNYFQIEILLFKITTNKNYYNKDYEGTNIIQFRYLINYFEKQKTEIILSGDFHKIPLFDRIDKYSKRFEKRIVHNNSELIYDGIHQWHYFEYQYQKQLNYGKGIMSIHFSNKLGVCQVELNDDQFRGTFLNSDFIFYISEDPFTFLRFKGQIINFSFYSNIDDLSIDLLQSCHFKCLTCDGPLEDNCLSCRENSNHIYFAETKKCVCKQGYYENQQFTCEIFQLKYNITVLEQRVGYSNFCDFGYFLKPDLFNNYECFKCPEGFSKEYFCIECINNPNQWYLNPYCSSKLVSRQITENNSYNIHSQYSETLNFIIDQNFELISKPELKQLCFESTFDPNNCQRLEFTHLNQLTFGKINSDVFQIEFKNQLLQQGCVEVGFQLYDCYNCFVKNCEVCWVRNQKLNICIKCNDGYGLKDMDGIISCSKCGKNCNSCDTFFECLQCKDKYVYSIDRKSCIKQNIDNCIEVFLARESDIRENSFVLGPFTYYSDFIYHCYICENFFAYILKLSKCLRMKNQQCLFGFADDIEVNKVNDWNIVYDEENSYYTTQINCLILLYQTNIQDQKDCSLQYEKCQACSLSYFFEEQRKKVICIACVQGYYWSTEQQSCLKCEEDFQNFICLFQTRKLSEASQAVPYFLLDQSNQSTDQDYFMQCDESCLECTERSYCLRCKQNNVKGRNKIAIDGICIQCPYNCAVCQPRTKIQIKEINPLFQNQDFLFYSHICLESYKDSDYYFDKQLRIFVKCENSNIGCQILYKIDVNIYCSSVEYYYDLEQIVEEKKEQFIKQNILFEQLSQLSEVFDEEFFEEGNRAGVRIIEFNILSQKSQVCMTSSPMLIENFFSSNIFSALNVTLNLKFEQIITFQLQEKIIFKNFQQISIQNLHFQFLQNLVSNLIIFEGFTYQFITFHQVNFFFMYESDNQILIIIKKCKLIRQSFITVSSQFLQKNFIFLRTQQIQENQVINFQNVSFENFNSQNWVFLNLNKNYNYQIEIQQFLIFNCTLENFYLVDILDSCQENKTSCHQVSPSSPSDDLGIIQIQNFFMEYSKIFAMNDQQNFKSFLNVKYFKFSQLQNFFIKFSNFSNIAILQIGQNGALQNFTIINCQLTSNVLFISNEEKLNNKQEIMQENFNYILRNFLVANNQYSANNKLIKFTKHNSITQQFLLFNFTIDNNYLISKQQINVSLIDSSLIFISAQIVEIMGLKIYKSFGPNTICLTQIFNLTLINTTISQREDFTELKLRESYPCLFLKESQRYEVISIFMHSIAQLFVQELNIEYVQSLNSPIIYYRSANPDKQSQNETLVFQRVIVKESLVLTGDQQSIIGILSIESNQISQISFLDCFFNQNILHHYQESVQQQGLLINVLAEKSSCLINNSNFMQNVVHNSTNSINYLQCQKIIIKDCIFQQNSIFSYQLIQKYLIWDFSDAQEIFFEDLRNKYPIKSLSGNGMLIFNFLQIERLNISNSQGVLGAVFIFQAKQQSKIKIQSINLFQLEVLYVSDQQKAGAIYIECTESLSLDIIAENIRAQNFFSLGQGGLFLVQNVKNDAKILFDDIQSVNQFSSLGSLFYILFIQQQEAQQSFKIRNTISYCTQIGYDYFTQDYFQKWALERQFLQSIQTNISYTDRALIFVEFGLQVELKNLIIYGLIYEQAVHFENLTSLLISQTNIFDCNIQQYLLYISFFQANHTKLENYQKSQLQILEFQIQNITQNSFILNSQCDFVIYQKFTICNKNNILSPDNLEFYGQNDRCISKELKIKGESGIIVILGQFSSQLHSKIRKLTFDNIYCSDCTTGLMSLNFKNDLKPLQFLENILILNSQCGQLGCLNLYKMFYFQNIGEQKLIREGSQQLILSNYICKNNSATNGTCLNFKNIDVQILNSNFMLNNASFAGGAVYAASNNLLFIENSMITQNQAFFGGGIYLNKSYPLLYEKLNTYIVQNQAFFIGSNVLSSPEKLQISFGQFSQGISLLKSTQNDQYFLEEYGIQGQLSLFGIETETLFYPNGQNISTYKYFDWKNRKYVVSNQNFRISAITNKGVIINEQENSYCTIYSKQEINSQFNNNQTNIQIVYYDEITNDYNLDNLTIYFENQQGVELQFNCSNIKVPIYNPNYPYNIIKYLDYILRIKFIPLECQLGEIINQNFKSCEVCDSGQGFFNLQLKETQCRMRDDLSTISVTPAQLQLRKYYWRPYFDSCQTSYCINYPPSCKGGWVEGDSSCINGHIGALCEQCDIYNIRGDGKFSRKSQFFCLPCQEQTQNIIIIVFLFIETLIQILIAAQSNFQSVRDQLQIIRMRLFGLSVIQKINQKAILIKMLTNYLQIIGYISTFQLKFSFDFDSIINFAANPTKQIVYTLNCQLSNIFSLEIHYLNMICQLYLPFLYIIIFLTLYFIVSLISQFHFTKSLIIATLIYIYIYFQPTLVGNLVQLISYRNISGFYWISANVAYRYDQKAHYDWILQLFLPAFVFLFICVPSLFFYVLLKNQNKLNSKEIRLKWGYLFTEYNSNAYLWEVMRILYKELLIVFFSYFEDNITLKSVIASLILLTYIELNIIFKPYASDKLNKLDQSSANVCFTSILLALCINYCQKYSVYYISIILSLILVSLNMHFMFVLFQNIIYQFFITKTYYFFNKCNNVRQYCLSIERSKFFSRYLKNQEFKRLKINGLYKKLKSFAITIGKQQTQKETKSSNQAPNFNFKVQIVEAGALIKVQ